MKMKRRRMKLVGLGLHWLALCAVLGLVSIVSADPSIKDLYKLYSPSPACKSCHETIFDEFSQSHHASSYSDLFSRHSISKSLSRERKKIPTFIARQKPA